VLDKPPRQNATGGPIQHYGEIQEAARHRQVRDVHCPGLIRAVDGQTAQQVRIDPMLGMPATGIGLPIQGFDPHSPHQRRYMLAANRVAVLPQQIA
jgi:hypothetical protein